MYFFFFVCLFIQVVHEVSEYLLAIFFLSLSPHSWSAGACFLSAPTMGGLLGSRCLRPWKRKSVQADEKYISLKTPLPFPWPLPCIYNPSFAAAQAKYVTFTSFSFFFSLFLSARYSSAAALLGLWRGGGILPSSGSSAERKQAAHLSPTWPAKPLRSSWTPGRSEHSDVENLRQWPVWKYLNGIIRSSESHVGATVLHLWGLIGVLV